MKFGNVRVNTQVQTHALHEAGCERIFTDTWSGSVACADWSELQRLDRQACNLKDLLTFVI